MSEKEENGGNKGFADGIAPMMAFAAAMNRAWLSAASLGGFPETGEGERHDASDAWKGAVETQMRAMAASWKSFNDIVMGSVDAVWEGQDKAAQKISDQMAAAFRNLTGMDPRDLMAGAGGDWSPQTVAFQSFGLADSDAAALTAELAQLATTSSEAARTMFDLYRVVGDAWMRAANAFAEANVETDTNLADPAALQRQWAATAEPILQQAFASDAFVKANADFIRAASRHSKARSALARRVAELIEVPNRQEMDETYEAIQELRREVRTLRRKQKQLEAALAGTRSGPTEEK